MSQTTDTVLADQSGASFRTELNAIISALNTDFTGATAPVTPEAYMRWLDTSVSPNVLRRRNAANSAWELHPTQQLATDAMPKAGGTFTGAYNSFAGADIASAATTSITTATGNYVNITGVTTITSLGSATQAGISRKVTFTGSLTLTHNAVSLILPSGANIQTSTGDTAEFISLGGSNWKCIKYVRSNGLGVVDGFKGADIASAATTNIAAASGDYVVITGTTTITGLGTAPAGVERTLRFSGVLTLTHNATSLILPTAANITTEVGDCAKFRSEGGGNWRCVSYQKASGLSVFSIFSKQYVSSQQTITSAGQLTLAHGLGTIPKLVTAELVCQIAEIGYSVNDVLLIATTIIANSGTNHRGVSVVPDATNLVVRFGSDANTFLHLNKTTGVGVTLTNANWRLVMRAYA